MRNKIMWIPIDFEIDDEIEDSLDNDDDEEESYTDKEDEKYGNPLSGLFNPKRVIMTNNGIFEVDNKLNPFRYMDVWMACTNFDISEEIAYAIADTPGVESIEILSPYRFMIGIGKMFEFRDVRTDIQNMLCDPLDWTASIDNDTIKNKAIQVHETLSKSPFWAMYIFPNGEIATVSDQNKSDKFLSDLDNLKKASELSKGLLICSDDRLVK